MVYISKSPSQKFKEVYNPQCYNPTPKKKVEEAENPILMMKPSHGLAISLGMLLTFEIPALEMGDHKKSIKIS